MPEPGAASAPIVCLASHELSLRSSAAEWRRKPTSNDATKAEEELLRHEVRALRKAERRRGQIPSSSQLCSAGFGRRKGSRRGETLT